MSSYRNIRDLIAHLASKDPLLYEALNRIDSELSEPDIITQTLTETIATSNTGWIKSGSNVRLDSPGDFVGVGTVAPTKRFSVAELVTVDDAGRMLAHAVPSYDMAAGVFGAGVMIDPSGVYGSDYGGNVSISSGKIYAGLNVTGIFPTISPGAFTEYTGIRSQVKNDGGNLDAITRAIIGQVRITGGGHGRGVYGVAVADAGATGFINALSVRTQPVATLTESFGIQIQNLGAGGLTKAIYIGQDDATSDYAQGIYFAPGVEFTDAAISLQTGGTNGMIRWSEMYINNQVADQLDFGTLGLYPVKWQYRATNGSYIEYGSLSEEITLSTVGLTTDSVANLLPADAIIFSVSSRVTQAISGGGAASFDVGDSTTANRFTSASALALGTTGVGTRQWNTQLNAATNGPRQNSASKVRITVTGGIPTQGKVRIVVIYATFNPPTS